MNVEVHSIHFSGATDVTHKVESLYKEYGERLVSWNVSEYASQYGSERYRLWYALKPEDKPTNID